MNKLLAALILSAFAGSVMAAYETAAPATPTATQKPAAAPKKAVKHHHKKSTTKKAAKKTEKKDEYAAPATGTAK